MITAAIAVASVSLLLAIVAMAQLSALRNRLKAVPKDGDIVGLMKELDLDLSAVEKVLADMQPRLEVVERAIPLAVSYVGVVTYNAFGDITGNQSRSVALLDRRGDGLVLSILVGRAETLFYTKQVRGRAGSEQLSPEEHAAIDRALAG